jgi:alginate O-acetyltransferase complex protein AlgJ
MMLAKNISPKMALPALLFGYAVIANLGVSAKLGSAAYDGGAATLSAFFHGELTTEFTDIYKDDLPHRHLAVGILGAARYLLFGEGRPGVVVGNDGFLFTQEEFRFIKDRSATISQAIIAIGAFNRDLSRRGVRLVMAPVAAKNDVYREELKNDYFPNETAALYRDFVGALKADNISVADSRAALLSAKRRELVFLKADTHWTPYGAKTVADQVVAQALGVAGRDFALVKDPPSQVEGDLVKYVTSDTFSGLLGLGQETITAYRAQYAGVENDLNDLFGATQRPPVALVGTSYSAVSLWSFAAFLSEGSGLDVANAAEVGRGPVYPMRRYIHSLDEGVAPARIVIWEFPIRYLTEADLWDQPLSGTR